VNQPAGVALIGAGFISYMHVLAARADPSLRAVALASRSTQMAEHRARIFGIDACSFDSLAEMLARDDVDIAVVASPVALHHEHTLAAIRAGLHVVVEKPMVMTLAEAAQIEAAARAAKVLIGYAENQAFTPLVAKARERIVAGAVGRVQRVIAVFEHGGPPRRSWFFDPRLAGGGAHLDLGAHALEVALCLIGKPRVTRVAVCKMARDGERGVDLTAVCELETASGIQMQISSSWAARKGACRYEVHGDAGTLTARFEPAPQSLTVKTANGEEDVDFPGGFDLRVDTYLTSLGYIGQTRHFAECFRNRTTPAESARDGENVLRVLAAGYMAARTSRSVEVADVPPDRTPIQLLDG